MGRRRLTGGREVSEHPAVVEKVTRYVVIHRELKGEPRGRGVLPWCANLPL